MQLTTAEPRNYRETVFDNPVHETPFPTTRSDVYIVAPMSTIRNDRPSHWLEKALGAVQGTIPQSVAQRLRLNEGNQQKALAH